MLAIYFFLKFLLFFAMVKALVKSDSLQRHVVALAVVYTALVAFISYVFVLSTNPNAFSAQWLMAANRRTGISPWLIWLASTWLLSTVYFAAMARCVENSFFWILLIGGIAVALF